MAAHHAAASRSDGDGEACGAVEDEGSGTLLEVLGATVSRLGDDAGRTVDVKTGRRRAGAGADLALVETLRSGRNPRAALSVRQGDFEEAAARWRGDAGAEAEESTREPVDDEVLVSGVR